MEKHELNQLESHIQALKTSHAALANTDELDELWRIIHNPGWTSIAELAFVVNGLESARAQTQQLATLKQGLVKAAKLVGTTRAAGA